MTRSGTNSLNLILTVAVIVLALGVIGGVLWFGSSNSNGPDGQGTQSAPAPAHLLSKPDSNTILAAQPQPNGKTVTVVEFLDYQCPVCQQYYQGLTSNIEREYQGRITFVVRNFPITSKHPLAQPAASAAEAAGMQGKYAPMYHALYDHYSSWAITPDGMSQPPEKAQAEFERYATQIGLNLEQFRRDQQSPQVTQRITADAKDAEAVGVNSTPSLFINGRTFELSGDTAGDLQRFRQILDQELR